MCSQGEHELVDSALHATGGAMIAIVVFLGSVVLLGHAGVPGELLLGALIGLGYSAITLLPVLLRRPS